MNKSKTKIVIASVLKPVDEVRNYEKIATSLSVNKNYEITVLGTSSKSALIGDQIATIAWGEFPRLSIKRLKVQGEFWRILIEIKPALIICTTFELLLVSVLYRLRFGAKIVYDIQEDYLKNLWHQKFYPFGLRHILGMGIRLQEMVLSPFISGYTLAEKTYKNDISFAKKNSLVLENKSRPILRENTSQNFKIIFTGTISTYSRTKESIDLYLMIKKELPKSTLLVIGYVPVPSYKTLLETTYEDYSGIELKLHLSPVSHSEIIKAISSAHLGIIGYMPNPVNINKVPTKLYEYTSATLPYLVQKGTHWAAMGEKLGGAIPIEFTQPDITYIKDRLATIETLAYAKSGYLWEECDAEIRKFISELIS